MPKSWSSPNWGLAGPNGHLRQLRLGVLEVSYEFEGQFQVWLLRYWTLTLVIGTSAKKFKFSKLGGGGAEWTPKATHSRCPRSVLRVWGPVSGLTFEILDLDYGHRYKCQKLKFSKLGPGGAEWTPKATQARCPRSVLWVWGPVSGLTFEILDFDYGHGYKCQKLKFSKLGAGGAEWTPKDTQARCPWSVLRVWGPVSGLTFEILDLDIGHRFQIYIFNISSVACWGWYTFSGFCLQGSSKTPSLPQKTIFTTWNVF